MSLPTPRSFAGKYEVERVLGQGGMGVVFLARHSRLGHRVAIKVLGHALREIPELVARFEREARAGGSLSSPHAVRVHDVDTTADGTPYIVMEPLVGCDLGHLLAREGPQPVARAARWILEACDAIAEAHARGIIHRDLKPSNLFLARDATRGRAIVKVLDFGVAKVASVGMSSSITQATAPLGTPQYMSPEQVRCARDVDERTDVWSLGVTLHELVTGSPPFPHEEPSACIAAIAADPLPDPRSFGVELPDAFVDVLARALAKDVRARFASVAELARALAPFAGEESTVRESAPIVEPFVPPPPPPAPSAPPPPTTRRRSFALATAALGLTALMVVAPKCVGEDDEPHAAASTVSSEPLEPLELPTFAVLAPPPPAVRELDTSAPPPVPSSAPATRRVVRRVVTSPPKRAALPAPSSTIHGGLSGPGF